MIDRHKVIKGLKCIAQRQEPTSNPCKDCGYISRPNFAICVKDIASDALELLKEQEAREQCLKTKCVICPHCDHCDVDENGQLKEQESLLGIQQTAYGITFISTGTAQQGEERGILLGKLLMHEWIYKELLHKELLTDDIRSVLEQAKRI